MTTRARGRERRAREVDIVGTVRELLLNPAFTRLDAAGYCRNRSRDTAPHSVKHAQTVWTNHRQAIGNRCKYLHILILFSGPLV